MIASPSSSQSPSPPDDGAVLAQLVGRTEAVNDSGWARSIGLADGPMKGRTQRRPPIMMTWTAVFSAIAILVALTVWTMQLQGPTIVPSGGATVPSVIGLSVADATKQLTDLGFTVEHRPRSDTGAGAGRGEPGTVQASNPAAGFVAPEGTHVELYVVPEPAPSASQSDASPPQAPPSS